MTEADAIEHLSHLWNKSLVFPNIHCCGCEMDLAVVTKKRFLWEVEVKLNLRDWKADQRKNKWDNPRRERIARMFYAVPGELIERCPKFVPTTTGLITLTPYLKVVRPATLRKDAPRVTDGQLLDMLESTYYRYWRERRLRMRAERAVQMLKEERTNVD